MPMQDTACRVIDNRVMSPIASTVLILLVAYLLGSLSGSLLLGRLRGVDIRTQGSGNAGGTNAFRTQGAKFAARRGADRRRARARWRHGWDCAARRRHSRYPSATAHGYAAAFAAAIGHVWPLWHGFRGGKGAATLARRRAGAVAVGGAAVAAGVDGDDGRSAVTSDWRRCWPACRCAAGGLDGARHRNARLLFACAAALLLLFTHRANLLRLLCGDESRFERARLLHRLRRPRA